LEELVQEAEVILVCPDIVLLFKVLLVLLWHFSTSPRVVSAEGVFTFPISSAVRLLIVSLLPEILQFRYVLIEVSLILV
jgi:hypothetical protein